MGKIGPAVATAISVDRHPNRIGVARFPSRLVFGNRPHGVHPVPEDPSGHPHASFPERKAAKKRASKVQERIRKVPGGLQSWRMAFRILVSINRSDAVASRGTHSEAVKNWDRQLPEDSTGRNANVVGGSLALAADYIDDAAVQMQLRTVADDASLVASLRFLAATLLRTAAGDDAGTWLRMPFSRERKPGSAVFPEVLHADAEEPDFVSLYPCIPFKEN